MHLGSTIASTTVKSGNFGVIRNLPKADTTGSGLDSRRRRHGRIGASSDVQAPVAAPIDVTSQPMRTLAIILMLAVGLVGVSGCRLPHARHGAHLPPHLPSPPPDMPRELAKVVLPTYTIQPPDILVIEAVHIVPRSPYALRTG